MMVARAVVWMGACAALLARPALASPEGDAVIARARAAEAAQLRALAGSSIHLHTRGWVNDGDAAATIESFRRLAYRADGTVSNVFERALRDGKPISEAELRRAIGAQSRPQNQGEVLTYALAPLSARDVEVTAVGPAPGSAGGYHLRCRIKGDALVSAVTLLVDAASGRKRSATMEIAGLKAKLADRLENVLTYADDGGPAHFRATFHVKLAWIERSAEFKTVRVPPPAQASTSGSGPR